MASAIASAIAVSVGSIEEAEAVAEVEAVASVEAVAAWGLRSMNAVAKRARDIGYVNTEVRCRSCCSFCGANPRSLMNVSQQGIGSSGSSVRVITLPTGGRTSRNILCSPARASGEERYSRSSRASANAGHIAACPARVDSAQSGEQAVGKPHCGHSKATSEGGALGDSHPGQGTLAEYVAARVSTAGYLDADKGATERAVDKERRRS